MADAVQPDRLELALARLVRSAAARRRVEDLERRRRLDVVQGGKRDHEAA